MTLLATPQQAAFVFGAEHVKAAKRNRYGMVGKLYLSKTGYLLLSVPNSLVRGAFGALNEPGVELPSEEDGKLTAHVTVVRPEELAAISGGADAIVERGRDFNYALGRIKSIVPGGWPEISRCWIIPVFSSELRKLRRTYGLSSEPKYPFHLTIACRRKGVLYENAIGKAASPVLQPFCENDDSAGGPGEKMAYNPEPAKDWVTGIASGDGRAFVEYMICHNKEDCDSGELDGISGKELRRLKREWTSLDSKEKLQYHRKTAQKKDPSYDPEHPEECCPHCGARLERGDDGDCNRCGKPWPKEAALGIPDRSEYGDLSRMKPGDLLDWVVQRHEAQKAGPHYDVRFGSPETGLYSWATRKKLPQPGQRRALFQQPVHEYGYKDYEGPLTGYGQGVVRTHQKGKILITGVRPDVITFSMATGRHPERFALVKPKSWKEKDWLLVNTTPTEAVPYDKVRYKKIPVEQVDQYIEQMKEGDSIETKIDGASSLIQLLHDGIELVSYRTSKKTGRPIIHTERFFGGPSKMDIPPELVGTVLKGEMYGQRRTDSTQDGTIQTVADVGRTGGQEAAQEIIPPQELGGILNAALAESLRKQRDQQVRLKNMVYDVQRFGKQDIDGQAMPRAERRKLIEQVLQHLPQDRFHISPAATTREEARKLWNRIRETSSTPATEGVVMWPRSGRPMKGKLVEDEDVHVTGTFPGKSRLAGRGIGGFEYALEPGGSPVGRVGTGLSEELREEAFRDPESFVGRVARIQAQSQFPSGAYRAPALIALHEDYPGPAVTKAGAEDKDQQAEISLDLANSLPQLILELPAHEDGKDSEKKPERPSPVLRIESKTVTTIKMGGRGLVLTPLAKKAGVKEDLAAAAKETDTDPTEAQIEAGNYKKGKISLHGLEISIENPKGSTRTGTNPDGTTWSTKLKAHYGYIKRTEGADSDSVDVFIGPDPESELVAVINQQDPGTKKFDEHKCILGCTSDAEARELYLANYEDGWQGLQDSALVTMPQFKWWLEHGDTTKPVKDGMFAKGRRKAASGEEIEEFVKQAKVHPFQPVNEDEDFWNSPPNKKGRKCPGCGKLFKECEPLSDVEMCETCERFGPPKVAQVEPVYRRALRTQLHSPKWNPQQGVLGNVFTNLHEARERGRRIIEEDEAMDRLRAGFDPGFAHRQFRAVLSGRYRPKVTNPIDQLVFQRTM